MTPEQAKKEMIKWHPDKWVNGTAKEKEVANQKFIELNNIAHGNNVRPQIVLNKIVYSDLELLGVGTYSKVFRARNGNLLKISSSPKYNAILRKEREVYKTLDTDIEAYGNYYKYFVPYIIDQGKIHYNKDNTNRFVTVIQHTFDEELYTLEEILERKGKLDAADFAWMFNRMLIGLSFLHSCGVCHGSVTPDNILVAPKIHGVQFSGLTFASVSGKITSVNERFKDWYPPETADRKFFPESDIYMACYCYKNACKYIPQPILNFLDGCMFSKYRLRPNDAIRLHDEFRNEVLPLVYGKPKFRVLEV